MTPKAYFDEVWRRCDLFGALFAYINANVSAAIQPEELLRAEWASRVSALDLYVHELVSQNLLKIFDGTRPSCAGFNRLQISSETLIRIKNSITASEKSTAFDLDVRTKLGRVTYQYPDDIADGIRLISPCKLWNEVAAKMGGTPATISADTEALKKQLSLIVDRRNKIVHEGDLQPGIPRTPWPINQNDVAYVTRFIGDVVIAIDSIV